MARARKPPAEPAPTTVDPVELALDAQARGPQAGGPAERVLLKHETLIGWQIAGQRAGFVLRVMTAIAGLLAAIVAGWAVWDASRYQGLVVQAFSAPPDLVARGLTGEVIAGELLDDLVRMQTQTESVRAAGSYAIDWGDKVEVEIPQTGVSIGDLQRVLREQLGRETRISGVVYRLPDGRLSVTARTGGAAGETFVGPETEFDALILKAAESVYGQTQPYRYAAYLKAAGRTEEAIKVLAGFQGRKDVEAAWALRGWAYIDMDAGHNREALAKLKQAIAIAPDMAALHYTLHQAEGQLGHNEAALTALRRAKSLFRSGRSKEVSPEGVATMLHIMDAQELALTGDFLGLARLERPNDGFGLAGQSRSIDKALAWGPAHEPEKALARLAERPLWNDDVPAHRFEDARHHYALATRLTAAGDWAGAIPHLRSAWTLIEQTGGADAARLFVGPLLAEALARSGRLAEAQAMVAPMPDDSDDGLQARAIVAALAGDRAGSDRLFARLIARAPSIPFGYAAWGQARLARGEAAEALKLFRQARGRAPNWADPLKLEGDALMALGRPRQARAAYARAARLAPRWGALHLAWGEAFAKDGQPEEARRTWRLAAGMLLAPAAQAGLAARLAAL
ncbi:MAG TPA: tetratricopeptide repeat protein [Caulobacter sp.]|nr:tetratricopeptide repeat protein [Caulobacter sp.]